MGVKRGRPCGHLGHQRARSGTSPSGRRRKIGAVLVTVNTAYKIHEAEYLLRQSDTHTLVMIDGYKDSELCRRSSRSSAPSWPRPEPGKPLHAKRLPFLRNVITVRLRAARLPHLGGGAGPLAEEVPVEEVYRRAASHRQARRLQYAVHLRHHRLPQGRHADALQRGQQRQGHRRLHGSFHRRPHDDSGADVPLLRHGAGNDRRR